MYVTRELYQGSWVNTYFETMKEAKAYCIKISKDGRLSMRMRCAK